MTRQTFAVHISRRVVYIPQPLMVIQHLLRNILLLPLRNTVLVHVGRSLLHLAAFRVQLRVAFLRLLSLGGRLRETVGLRLR